MKHLVEAGRIPLRKEMELRMLMGAVPDKFWLLSPEMLISVPHGIGEWTFDRGADAEDSLIRAVEFPGLNSLVLSIFRSQSHLSENLTFEI